MKNNFKSQSGFSLVTSIFILVILSILGSYMVMMVSTQNQSTVLSVQGYRAWYAAVSGLEWTAYQIEATGNCPSVPTIMVVEGFSVQLTDCTAYAITEAGGSYNMHDVTVMSESGNYGDIDYVSRTLRATLGGS